MDRPHIRRSARRIVSGKIDTPQFLRKLIGNIGEWCNHIDYILFLFIRDFGILLHHLSDLLQKKFSLLFDVFIVRLSADIKPPCFSVILHSLHHKPVVGNHI